MARSYERINYSLRPAKNIQRKMLAAVFQRLNHFGRLKSYRYIGFGSTFFSDFSLFHKTLGIVKMLSIERDVDRKERFESNKPFQCIEMDFRESNAALPALDWNQKTILWLDYDDKLTSSVLTDVQFFCSSAPGGSVIVVTVNAEPDDLESDKLKLMRDRVGPAKLPQGTEAADLEGWELAKTSRAIMTTEIEDTIRQRNGALPGATKLEYHQLFNFHYADGAKMLTIGGVICEEGQSPELDSCDFTNMEFVKTEAEPFHIEVPSLTFKELRVLDRALPHGDLVEGAPPGVPQVDVDRYAQVYRYFPTFVDAEF